MRQDSSTPTKARPVRACPAPKQASGGRQDYRLGEQVARYGSVLPQSAATPSPTATRTWRAGVIPNPSRIPAQIQADAKAGAFDVVRGVEV